MSEQHVLFCGEGLVARIGAVSDAVRAMRAGGTTLAEAFVSYEGVAAALSEMGRTPSGDADADSMALLKLVVLEYEPRVETLAARTDLWKRTKGVVVKAASVLKATLKKAAAAAKLAAKEVAKQAAAVERASARVSRESDASTIAALRASVARLASDRPASEAAAGDVAGNVFDEDSEPEEESLVPVVAVSAVVDLQPAAVESTPAAFGGVGLEALSAFIASSVAQAMAAHLATQQREPAGQVQATLRFGAPTPAQAQLIAQAELAAAGPNLLRNPAPVVHELGVVPRHPLRAPTEESVQAAPAKKQRVHVVIDDAPAFTPPAPAAAVVDPESVVRNYLLLGMHYVRSGGPTPWRWGRHGACHAECVFLGDFSRGVFDL